MEIIIIIFFVVILIVVLSLIFILFRWILTNKKRTIFTVSLIGFYLIAILINNLFFKKMEFIQSKVYPHLYLIKNPIRDKDSLKKIIKEMVIQKMNAEFIGNEEKYKYRFDRKKQKEVILTYSIEFYEHYTGDLFSTGTVWFIDHEEDPGGFSSEFLSDYEDYSIAGFTTRFCKNDTINYNGILYYSKMKNDTIFNLCK